MPGAEEKGQAEVGVENTLRVKHSEGEGQDFKEVISHSPESRQETSSRGGKGGNEAGCLHTMTIGVHLKVLEFTKLNKAAVVSALQSWALGKVRERKKNTIYHTCAWLITFK